MKLITMSNYYCVFGNVSEIAVDSVLFSSCSILVYAQKLSIPLTQVCRIISVYYRTEATSSMCSRQIRSQTSFSGIKCHMN
jgi:hypothetical protein